VVALGGGEHFDVVGSPLQVGDRIIFTFSRCDHCLYCTVLGMPNLCSSRRSYGANAETYPYLVGGFAEYCYVYPGSRRVKIPEGVKPEWASAASCALRSVVGAFQRLGAIEPWETLTIQGAGPLGLFATALASVSGAARIVVIGDPAERLTIAQEWGATDVVSVAATADGEARIQAVRDLTGGAGADIVMEFSGARTAFAEGVGMIRRGGRYVVAGQVGPQEVAFRPTQITQGGLTILGSYSAAESEYWKAIQFMDRYKERFDFDRILSNRFHLNQVHDALTRMQQLQEIKPVIIPAVD
jgi:L-iditol 2-dehydrogenase